MKKRTQEHKIRFLWKDLHVRHVKSDKHTLVELVNKDVFYLDSRQHVQGSSHVRNVHVRNEIKEEMCVYIVFLYTYIGFMSLTPLEFVLSSNWLNSNLTNVWRSLSEDGRFCVLAVRRCNRLRLSSDKNLSVHFEVQHCPDFPFSCLSNSCTHVYCHNPSHCTVTWRTGTLYCEVTPSPTSWSHINYTVVNNNNVKRTLANHILEINGFASMQRHIIALMLRVNNTPVIACALVPAGMNILG